MNTKKLMIFISSFVVLMACNRQSEITMQNEDVDFNNKGFKFLQAYYDECDSNYLDSARCFFEKALKCNDGNSVAFYNLMLILGAQEEYKEMVELYQKRINQLSENAYLAKAETYSDMAILYGKIGDTLSYCEMTQKASNEFEKCFNQKPVSVDLVISFLMFSAFKDGKESAILELKKFEDVFPDEDYYSAFKSQLMEYNPDDYFSLRCN
ncbi:MAG: tetratricopeptide repeat protein [Bacteroidales bacterium]|nr:tetratricopeptide repeat protein [Bacteroidales bacterium]